MSDFTPEQVERAAGVLCRQKTGNWWADISEWSKEFYREDTLKILSAAGAPEKLTTVVDEAALAAVIARAECNLPANTHLRDRQREVSAAVVAYLRGESK